MPNGNRIKPTAIIAGAAAAGLLLYIARGRYQKCTEFPGIWSKEGPIHLTTSANIEAREFMQMKILDAQTANIEITPRQLQLQAADYLSPDCDWSELDTIKAQQIFSSLGTFAHSIYQESLKGQGE